MAFRPACVTAARPGAARPCSGLGAPALRYQAILVGLDAANAEPFRGAGAILSEWADDIVQEVFLAFLRQLEHYDAARGGVQGYLLGIARQIEGVTALGRKRTEVIAAGRIGNDRPIEIVDERWESAELKLVVQSRHSDPRTGVVDYRLVNISRSEPSPDLFVVPADYTIVEARDERLDRRERR